MRYPLSSFFLRVYVARRSKAAHIARSSPHQVMGISHAKRFDVDEILYQHCVKKLLGGYLAARVALGLELPKQLDGRPTPGIPALEEIVCIRVEHAASVVATVLGLRPHRHLEIPLDGPAAAPDLRGNSDDGVPLAVQGPDLLIARLPDG